MVNWICDYYKILFYTIQHTQYEIKTKYNIIITVDNLHEYNYIVIINNRQTSYIIIYYKL